MATEQQYRDKAKAAREKAQASDHPDHRRRWLEIAKAYEHLAETTTPWHVERVEPKKKKR